VKTSLWTPGNGLIDRVLPAGAFATTPRKGMELVNLAKLGIMPGLGGGRAHGTHVAGDVVTQTASGTDLNVVWRDFLDLLNAANSSRQALLRFLTFDVTNPTELVAQAGGGVDFERSTEFGEPVGARIQPTYFNLGYTFFWYDLAARYTWQYLADATDTMVNSVADAAVEAWLRLQVTEVLRTIFNNTNLGVNINQQAYVVYKFYNADGTVPPSYKTNTFDGTHTHYKTTGGAGANTNVLEATDLDVLVIDDFESHGYSISGGYRFVLMANKANSDTIRGFRSVVNGGTGRYDFLPAQGQPGQIMLQNQNIVGQVQAVPNTLDGLDVIGTYGPLIIVKDDYMPASHVLSFATGGSESLNNPVGFRQHAQTSLRGLRLVKGRNPDYPLIDSFWSVGFGTGIRQRGGGIVLQLASGTSYTPPTEYA